LKFLFLRHGETLWNLEKRCQGQTDIALSQKGLKEAEHFSKKSVDLPIHHIFSSPLKRALSTAEILQKSHPEAQLTILDAFQERNYGCLEGQPSTVMYAFEEEEKTNPDRPIDPTIENLKAIELRIKEGLKLAFAISPNPFIVSHGRLFLSLCTTLNVPQIHQIKNLSLYEFKKNSNNWEMRQILFD
jgi:broad specificity phosphatase PhoE